MKSLLWAVVAGVLACTALTACIEDDFTTSPSHILSFSTDTLSFDTVFTEQTTPTAKLKVYNRASKSVNISSIRFRHPDGIFQMNVDGISGTGFHDIEIRGGDSIFVFVECKLPLSPDNAPLKNTDAIEFVTNGITQQVELVAWGQNVDRWHAKRLTADTRITARLPVVVYDSLVVDPGVTLTIDPGAQVLFHDKASLVVYGTLHAVGAPGRIIDLRGDRLDNVLPDVKYDIMAGQWHGVSLRPQSYGNRLEYVNMRSTVAGLQIDSCAPSEKQKLFMYNSWLHNSRTTVLKATNAGIRAIGTCLSDAAGHVVDLQGGTAEFTQCTFANYYLFAAPSQSIVGLYNVFGDDTDTCPPMQGYWRNCIIYGLAPDLNVGDLENSNVYFENTLMRSAGNDDANFIDCLWDTDALFATVRNDYIFDYRVLPGSPAIDAGNPAWLSPPYTSDVSGISFLPVPTLGAYQFAEPKEIRRFSSSR